MKLRITTGIIGLILSLNVPAQTSSLPNVLFIFADDQTFESIGSLNNNEIKTPNLDQLKDMGATFTHTFNQGSWAPAVCVASRTMLNTGKYIWKAARYSAKAAKREDPNLPEKMAEYEVKQEVPKGYWSEFMKAEGYDTYFAGKWHVGRKVNEIFDVCGTVRGGMPNQTRERYERKFIEGEPDTWSPYDKSKEGYWKGGKHWSEVLGDEALGFLDAATNDEDPFFMYLAFNAPHDPRQSPKEYVNMYPLENISVPESFLTEYPYCEEAGAGPKLRDEKLAPFPRTEHSVKINRQEYYAIITHMDAQVGRILEALEKSGKADNTYIIFTADHGLALGDHGYIGKQNMYDRSMRVPLFVAGPGIKAGKVIDEKVYLQDAMATALDIAGSKALKEVDFTSLLPLCMGTSKKGNEAVYGAYLGNQRMIRTDRYKMIVYPTANVVRLYDLKKDPWEMHDLAGDAKYKKQMDKLMKQFIELQKEVADPLDIREYYTNFFANLNKEALMQAIEDYENAWASGDFLTVESFFAKNAKRLHTEPYVWDREEIKRYFEERASQPVDSGKTFVKNQWKKDREYLDIRVEENIAYDVFTTDKFKALHIWEKQEDGSWKIQYDVGMLNYPCDN